MNEDAYQQELSSTYYSIKQQFQTNTLVTLKCHSIERIAKYILPPTLKR